MSRGRNRRLCGLVTVALLVGSVAPVATQVAPSGSRGFHIELDEVLAVEEISFDTEGLPTGESTAPIRLASLNVAEVSANQETSAPVASKTKRTGRWLKKHWWVPTLIGVAVGVALLEPFDDDDDERRRAQMNR